MRVTRAGNVRRDIILGEGADEYKVSPKVHNEH